MLTEATKRLEAPPPHHFPEGTRHTDGKVAEEKAASVCWRHAAASRSVPSLIFDSNNLHFRSRICVRVGKPIYAADYG